MIWRLVAPYVIGALAVAAVLAAGRAWWLSGRLDTLRAENAVLARSVSALRLERNLAREAQAVADAYAANYRAQAEEYDRLRETLLDGDDDAPVPDWLAAYLRRLFADGNHPDLSEGPD